MQSIHNFCTCECLPFSRFYHDLFACFLLHLYVTSLHMLQNLFLQNGQNSDKTTAVLWIERKNTIIEQLIKYIWTGMPWYEAIWSIYMKAEAKRVGQKQKSHYHRNGNSTVLCSLCLVAKLGSSLRQVNGASIFLSTKRSFHFSRLSLLLLFSSDNQILYFEWK